MTDVTDVTELQTLKPGTYQPRSVAALGAALRVRGYHYDSRTFDTHYRRSLVHAVKRFQAQHLDTEGRPLDVDGIVGPLTWAAVLRPIKDLQRSGLGCTDVPRIPIIGAGIAADRAALMLSAALADYDAARQEDPLGSNLCPWLETRAQGKPWCDFQVHAWIRAALGKWLFGGFRGSTKISLREATKRGLLVHVPRPGDVFLLLDAKGVPYHTGLVLRLEGSIMDTVEGNTANRVAVRRREIDDRVTFYRPFPGELEWTPGLLPGSAAPPPKAAR